VGVTDDNDSICEECAEPEYPEALVETLHAVFSKAYYSRVPIITRADADAAQRAGLVAALDALGLAEVWDAGYDVGQDDCRDGGRGETNPYREGPRDRD
jgi:hypothetical protein